MTLVLTSCTQAYGRRAEPVLREFGYELPDGLTVLLGPEGAGKSTVLRLAASELAPRSGTVALDGEPAGSRAFRRAVGWVPQGVVPLPSLSARDHVAYVGWLKGMRRGEAWSSAADALERVELADLAGRKTSRLAADELARVHLAACLVHGARVLLLDEPTAGLHLHQREAFLDTLAGLTRDDGVRVLLTARDVAALPGLARKDHPVDHVAVLDTAQDAGAMLHTGTTAAFLAHAPAHTPRREAPAAAYAALVADAAQ